MTAGSLVIADHSPGGPLRPAALGSGGPSASAAAVAPVLADFFSHPVAIAEAGLPALREIAANGYTPAAAGGGKSGRRRASTALLPLMGILFHRANVLTDAGYGTPLDEWTALLRALGSDPDVSEILLWVDSLGGSVYGTAEAADAVWEVRQKKPVRALVDSCCASAGYWIASQATEVVVTPGGEVGSIGVYLLHVDYSRAAEREGLRFTYVYAGERKVAANPYEQLGQLGRAEMQAGVDDYYRAFVRAVARGRKTTQTAVRDGFGRGGMVRAAQAVAEGMADRIAPAADSIAGRNWSPAAASATTRPAPVADRASDLEVKRRRDRFQADQELDRRRAQLRKTEAFLRGAAQFVRSSGLVSSTLRELLRSTAAAATRTLLLAHRQLLEANEVADVLRRFGESDVPVPFPGASDQLARLARAAVNGGILSPADRPSWPRPRNGGPGRLLSCRPLPWPAVCRPLVLQRRLL